MNERKQSSTLYPVVFFLASAGDGRTGVVGASVTMKISKNGAAASTASGSITEIDADDLPGHYSWAGHASDRDTIGDLAWRATAPASDAEPSDGKIVVVPWDPFNVNLSLGNLDAAISDIQARLPRPSGTVATDGGNSATSFKTSLVEVTNHWKDALLVFTSGALLYQVKKVSAYDGGTKIITVVGGYTATPADGASFILVSV
jgi:hypothetical protein